MKHDDSMMEPVLAFMNVIEELRSVITLCQPSRESQSYYQNVFSYHYLKTKVLTITNPDDYKLYLDPLLATDTSIGDFGALYLQSVADGARPPGDHVYQSDRLWLHPSMFFPGDEPAGLLADIVAGGAQPQMSGSACSRRLGCLRSSKRAPGRRT